MKLLALDRLPLAAVAPSSRLGADYLSNVPAALPFYPHRPGDYVGAAGFFDPRRGRATLAAVLEAANRRLGAAGPALDQALRLGQPGALAVVTGQQAAPFGGPLYTILKAAATIAHARRLEPLLGRPVVPVFWVEGDDHDAAEAGGVVLANDGQALGRLEFPWQPVGGPVGDFPLPWTFAELAERLRALLPSTPRGEAAVALGVGEMEGTLGPWCCRFLAQLFSAQGLVVAYSREPALRALWWDLVPRLVEEAPALAAEAAEAAVRIRAAGYRPQVQQKAGALPYFVIAGGLRLPVRRDGRRLVVGEERMTTAELTRRLADDPGAFSPGVLLRPLVQDTALPTVAYVGGLAEASYFGQLTNLYRRLGVPCPVVTPRLYATLVEPGRERVLGKLGISPSRFLQDDPDRLFSAVLRERGGAADARRWERLRERSRAPLLKEAAKLPADQAPLRGYLENVAGRIGHLVAEAGERMARENRSREETLRRQIAETSFILRPAGRLQERTMNVLYFLAKYGDGFVSALVEDMPDDLAAHWFLAIRESES